MTPPYAPKPFYDVDGITIWHADCAAILPTIETVDVDLLLTDPPYGINLNTDYDAVRIYEGGLTYAPVMGDAEPFDPAHLLDHARCVIFGANNFVQDLPEQGAWLVWDKVTRNGITTRGSDAEMAWCRGVAATGMTFVYRHMWKGAFRDSERGHLLHPTQKPVTLMRWILEKWTEPGDLILDPYMGSGPIARACADLGRRYIGIEIEERYCQAAVDRLGQLAMVLP